MAADDAEVTVICIDNSTKLSYRWGLRDAQLEAIKLYCTTKLQCNPENSVGLFTMGSGQFKPLLNPTRDLSKILDSLQNDLQYSGEVEFSHGVGGACFVLSKTNIPSHMKRRVLMFVGGFINLRGSSVKPLVKTLKREGAALDVVNFFSLNMDYKAFAGSDVLTGKYRYAKEELDALVTGVNYKDNSHIVHVEDQSSVVEILSNSAILKMHLHYIEEKKRVAEAEHVKASRCPAKKTRPITREDRRRCRTRKQLLELYGMEEKPKKGTENVNLNQVSETSRNGMEDVGDVCFI